MLPAADRVAQRHRFAIAIRLQLRLGRGVDDERGRQTDFDARVRAVVGVLGEVKARLTKLADGVEQRHELGLCRVAANQHRTVVAVLTLRLMLPPFAGLGIDHLFVIGAEERDGGRATDTAADHRAGGEHEDVVGLNGAHFAARDGVEHGADFLQRLLQRLMARSAAAAGAQHRALGTDLGEVELDVGAVVVARDQFVHRVGPALDGVGDGEMPHRQIFGTGAQRERRQTRDVLLLHAEADPSAAEKEPECLTELLHIVDVPEGAVVHAGVVHFDGVAAKLHRAHGRERLAIAHGSFGDVDQLTKGAIETERLVLQQRGEARPMHVEDALRGLGPQLTAAQIFAVASVLRHRDVVADAADAVPGDASVGLPGAIEHEALRDLEVS